MRDDGVTDEELYSIDNECPSIADSETAEEDLETFGAVGFLGDVQRTGSPRQHGALRRARQQRPRFSLTLMRKVPGLHACLESVQREDARPGHDARYAAAQQDLEGLLA